MSIPLALPLILAGLGAGTNIAGRLFSRPKRPNVDIEKLMAAYSARQAQDMNPLLSSAAQGAGMQLAGRGIGGGAAVQGVAGAQAPIYSEAARNLANARLELERYRQERMDQYDTDKRDWMAGLFGDVAGGLGAGAGILGSAYGMQEPVKQVAGQTVSPLMQGANNATRRIRPFSTGTRTVGLSSPYKDWFGFLQGLQ